jgi:hypothetical protein
MPMPPALVLLPPVAVISPRNLAARASDGGPGGLGPGAVAEIDRLAFE